MTTNSHLAGATPQTILQNLARLRQKNTVYPFKFAGQLFFADGRHALYWPDKNTLIVSDLHLGKGQSLNRHGNILPTLDTAATLNLLQRVIADYIPEHVIALGDSFHDKFSGQQMSEVDRQKLTDLCKSVPVWTWILGNHDENMQRHWPGRYEFMVEQQGVYFVHEPQADVGYQIIGHFHPKHTARLKGAKLSGRCFVHNHRTLIMPSFGSYTGGLSIEHEAIQEVLQPSLSAIFLCHKDQVFSLSPDIPLTIQ